MSKKRYLENTLPKETIEKIILLYKNNVSLREIEKQVPATRRAIGGMLERLGIKTTKGNHYRKYFFDFDFFEKIDNELKAYWLGFLYADGCVHKQDNRGYGEQEFSLALQKTDEEILQWFCKDLKSTYPIRYDSSKHNKKESCQIIAKCQWRSQKTVDDLKKLGCVENKSLILTFPTEEQVPRKFIYDFIRGYFDGDGSISSFGEDYHINFVGTEAFIKELSTYFKGGSVFPDKRKTNSWYYSINGNLQILEAYHKMYDNKERFLKRKYEKFIPLINKYEETQGV